MSARAVFVLPAKPDRLELLYQMKADMKHVFELFGDVNRTSAGARDGAVCLARAAQRFADRCNQFAEVTASVNVEIRGIETDARAAEKA